MVYVLHKAVAMVVQNVTHQTIVFAYNANEDSLSIIILKIVLNV